MKRLFFIVFILTFLYVSLTAQVLAEAGGYRFTEQDFQKEMKFVEFLFNQKLRPSEEQMLKQSEIEAFKENPRQVLANVQSLDQQMQQLYALTDPLQIGIAQSVVVGLVYNQLQQDTQNDDPFNRLFYKYVKVLAYDPQTQLALTKADVDAYFDYMEFIYSLYGQPVTIDEQTRQAYAQSFANYFLNSDQQTKASLAAMDVIVKFYLSVYEKLTPEQKEQFRQSLLAQSQASQSQYDQYSQYNQYNQSNANNYNYSTDDRLASLRGKTNYTKQELDQIMQIMRERQQMSSMMFNTMNNIMNINHAAASNVISNIGSGDTYWEVVDY